MITLEEASLRLTEMPTLMMFRSGDMILNFNQPFRRAIKISARLSQIRTGGEAQIKAISHEVPIVNCSTIKFHEAAEQRLVNLKLDKRAFLCFDFAALKLPEEEKMIRNSYGSANSNTLVLNIKKCDEKADPGCRTYLDKVMPNFTFTSSIPTYTLDISNYDSPIEFSSKTINSSLTKDFFTGQLLSMDYNQLETDEGWFIDSIKKNEFFTKGNVEYSFGPYEEKDSLLYELLIDAPAVQTKVNRSYVKVQEVLANVGGFMKTLMMISTYLTKGYSEYIFLKRLEAVFEFEEIRKSKKEMKINNLVLPNQKESALEVNLKIQKFKTGMGVTEMKALETSVISYLKYFLGSCCKKKKVNLNNI